MDLRGKGLDLQALAECVCCLLLGILLFCLTYSGRYLNYVTPKMKPYLYGFSLLLFLWAGMQARYLPTPRYRISLSRSFVMLIPILMLAMPLPASEGRGIAQDYGSSGISKVLSGNENGNKSEDEREDNGEDERPWYDLKGLDKETKTITIGDEDYYTWIYELSSFYETYIGYTVVMKGFVYRAPDMDEKCGFALVRLSMWCCSADLSPLGFLVDCNGDLDLQDGDWVVVRGILGVTEDGGSLLLKAQSIEAAEKPQEEYVYPYF